MALLDFITPQNIVVVAGYKQGRPVAVVAAALVKPNNWLQIRYPKVNPFEPGEKVTVHLDARIGQMYTAELKVYRTSYKGIVSQNQELESLIAPEEYTLIHSTSIVDQYQSSRYDFPLDPRLPAAVKPENTAFLSEKITPSTENHSNKLGVLITKGVERPHTTLMAFLSSEQDDIFFISHSGTFKSKLLSRDPECLFAIDHRDTFTFETAIDWNYSIIRGKAAQIPKNNTFFSIIQRMFIEKNPWEIVFFTDPKVELFYLKPESVICPETLTCTQDLLS